MEINKCDNQTIIYSIICAHHKIAQKQKPPFRDIYKKPTAYNGTTTWGTQPRKHMTTMGDIDTSDLTMSIRWVTNSSSQLPNLNESHTTTYIAEMISKVTERTNCLLDTLSTEYNQQDIINNQWLVKWMNGCRISIETCSILDTKIKPDWAYRVVKIVEITI